MVSPFRPLAGGNRSPRLDTHGAASPHWSEPALGLGGEMDRGIRARFDPGSPLSQFETRALVRFLGIARKLVATEPEDAVREGIEFANLDPVVEIEVQSTLARLDALSRMSEAHTWAKAGGGGIVVIFAKDGRRSHEPVNLATLEEVCSLVTFDRSEVSPVEIDTSPDGGNFGEPKIYQVHAQTGGATMHVHHSRVLRFDGLTLPRVDRIGNDYWHGSELEPVYDAIRNWGLSHRFAGEAVTLLNQGIFYSDIEGMNTAGGSQAIANRIAAIRAGMSIMGDVILQKDSESYESIHRPMTGVADALRSFESAILANTPMPRSRVFGDTKGGINSGEVAGETRAWYDHVAARRKRIYTPRALHLLELIFRSKAGPTGGEVPRGYEIKWPALWQESPGERAKTRLTNAQARAIDSQSVCYPDEVRKDPELVELYGLDPDAPAPGLPDGGDPGGFEGDDEGPIEDEDDAIVATSLSLIPPGEVPESAKSLAEAFGVSPSMIRGMARREEIRAFRFGARFRYLRSEVEAAASGGRPAKKGDRDDPLAVGRPTA